MKRSEEDTGWQDTNSVEGDSAWCDLDDPSLRWTGSPLMPKKVGKFSPDKSLNVRKEEGLQRQSVERVGSSFKTRWPSTKSWELSPTADESTVSTFRSQVAELQKALKDLESEHAAKVSSQEEEHARLVQRLLSDHLQRESSIQDACKKEKEALQRRFQEEKVRLENAAKDLILKLEKQEAHRANLEAKFSHDINSQRQERDAVIQSLESEVAELRSAHEFERQEYQRRIQRLEQEVSVRTDEKDRLVKQHAEKESLRQAEKERLTQDVRRLEQDLSNAIESVRKQEQKAEGVESSNCVLADKLVAEERLRAQAESKMQDLSEALSRERERSAEVESERRALAEKLKELTMEQKLRVEADAKLQNTAQMLSRERERLDVSEQERKDLQARLQEMAAECALLAHAQSKLEDTALALGAEKEHSKLLQQQNTTLQESLQALETSRLLLDQQVAQLREQAQVLTQQDAERAATLAEMRQRFSRAEAKAEDGEEYKTEAGQAKAKLHLEREARIKAERERDESKAVAQAEQDALRASIRHHKEQLHLLREELTQLLREASSRAEREADRSKDLADRLAALSASHVALKQQLELTQSDLEELRALRGIDRGRSDAFEMLQREMDRLKAENSNLAETVKTERDSYRASARIFQEQLDNQLADMTGKLHDVTSRLEEKDRLLAERARVLSEREAAALQHRMRLDALEQDMRVLQVERERAVREREMDSRQHADYIDACAKEISALQKDRDRVMEDRDALQKRLLGRMQQMQAEMDALNAEREKLLLDRGVLDVHKERTAVWLAEAESSLLERHKLTVEIAALEAALDSMREQNARLVKDKAACVESCQAEVARVGREKAEELGCVRREAADELERVWKDRRDEVGRVQREKSMVVQELEKLRGAVEAERTERHGLEAEVEQSHERIRWLEEQLEAGRADAKQRDKIKAETDQQVNALREKLEAKGRELERCQAEFSQHLQRLEAEATGLRKDRDDAQETALREKEQIVDKWSKEKEHSESLLKEARERCAVHEKRADDAENALQALKSEMQEVRGRFRGLERELQSQVETSGRLENENEVARGRYERELQTRQREASESMAWMETQLRNLSQERADALHALMRDRSEREMATRTAEECRLRLDTEVEKTKALQDRISCVRSELEAARQQLESFADMKKTNTLLSSQLQSAQGEVEAMKEELNRVQTCDVENRTHITLLRRQLSEREAASAAYKREVEKEVSAIESRLKAEAEDRAGAEDAHHREVQELRQHLQTQAEELKAAYAGEIASLREQLQCEQQHGKAMQEVHQQRVKELQRQIHTLQDALRAPGRADVTLADERASYDQQVRKLKEQLLHQRDFNERVSQDLQAALHSGYSTPPGPASREGGPQPLAPPRDGMHFVAGASAHEISTSTSATASGTATGMTSGSGVPGSSSQVSRIGGVSEWEPQVAGRHVQSVAAMERDRTAAPGASWRASEDNMAVVKRLVMQHMDEWKRNASENLGSFNEPYGASSRAYDASHHGQRVPQPAVPHAAASGATGDAHTTFSPAVAPAVHMPFPYQHSEPVHMSRHGAAPRTPLSAPPAPAGAARTLLWSADGSTVIGQVPHSIMSIPQHSIPTQQHHHGLRETPHSSSPKHVSGRRTETKGNSSRSSSAGRRRPPTPTRDNRDSKRLEPATSKHKVPSKQRM